ncbi:cytoplasmic protein [Pedobacter changchengzhani]|uniref:Cytoplasmic protein n=1 Tax=Pedobacter changchengzhani TaxID=2529274 RepID=A0A4R5MH59_9SPHI|nr:DUF6434 domain-containing protein [Pedobacter changchengzhani]TDG34801.1 cytoplasmic protein [Pedobacter changchengzhani]
MERPNLDNNISLTDFKEFYWLKEELVEFCKQTGISTSGSKVELNNKIQHYFLTGKVVSNSKTTKTILSNFDWNNEPLNLMTIITDSYKNSENVRTFFIEQIGSNFSFNVKFMKWMKENSGKNLKDAVEHWKQLKEIRKDKNFKSEIEPQFEYNRYMRAFLSDNPNLSSKDAMKFWNLKRAKRGTNEYERTDLELK